MTCKSDCAPATIELEECRPPNGISESQSPCGKLRRNTTTTERRCGATSRNTARRTTASCCPSGGRRSEEHTSELQSHSDLVCRLLLEKKKNKYKPKLIKQPEHKQTYYCAVTSIPHLNTVAQCASTCAHSTIKSTRTTKMTCTDHRDSA